MRFWCFVWLNLMVFASAYSQIRLTKLELRPKEIYSLQTSDILVADTIIMGDSSSIVLAVDKKDSFIHSKKIITGKNCKILGNGSHGKTGRNGVKGLAGEGPCQNGVRGKNGTGGSHGDNGINLSIYCSDLKIGGKLFIELNGGNGGDGGTGGEGGGGSPGTRVCAGGNGGDGGNGSSGGNGADGGNLIVACKDCTNIRLWLNQSLVVRAYGGHAGLGGIGGAGGSAGLSPSGSPSQDGKPGARGKEGPAGLAGKNGSVNFQ
jgi:hypothetical protein